MTTAPSTVTLTPARPTNLLHITPTLHVGGSEQLVANVAGALDPQRWRSHFLAMQSDGQMGQRLRTQGHTAEALRRPARVSPGLVWQVRQRCKAWDIDVVLSHHLQGLIYGGTAARLAGARLIQIEHDLKDYEDPQNRRWLRLLGGLPHAFVAIDAKIADFLTGEMRFPAERVHTIRNGIDLDRFADASTDTETAGYPPPQTMGWVGRLFAPKRPDVFVDAFVELAARHPRLRCIMAGPGELMAECERKIAAAGLGDRAEILGARSDVPQLLARMDAYVLASDSEGLPIALVEAMAAEKVCIASDVGGIGELIDHGVNGLLLRDNTAAELVAMLEPVLSRPTDYLSMRHAARDTAERDFSLETMMAAYRSLLDEVRGV